MAMYIAVSYFIESDWISGSVVKVPSNWIFNYKNPGLLKFSWNVHAIYSVLVDLSPLYLVFHHKV